MKLDKYLLLSWKKVLIIACAWMLSVLLHNLIYGLFYDYFMRTVGDEAVIFFLLFLIPLYFIISLVYTVIRVVRSRAS